MDFKTTLLKILKKIKAELGNLAGKWKNLQKGTKSRFYNWKNDKNLFRSQWMCWTTD